MKSLLILFQLGIPTANIPLSGLSVGGHDDIESGIYFGWAALGPASADSKQTDRTSSSSSHVSSPPPTATSPDLEYPLCPPDLLSQLRSVSSPPPSVYPMVMSIGWNPYYKNTVRSVEVHLLHRFAADFYGHAISVLVLGFVRPEYDYVDRDALIDDIRTDIAVAAKSLAREGYVRFCRDPSLVEGVGIYEGSKKVVATPQSNPTPTSAPTNAADSINKN